MSQRLSWLLINMIMNDLKALSKSEHHSAMCGAKQRGATVSQKCAIPTMLLAEGKEKY